MLLLLLLSQSVLSGRILRDTLGFGSKGRIMEQQWQKEFYRIGTQVLGMDHFLSCEVGTVFGCEGKIDFYVDKLDWVYLPILAIIHNLPIHSFCSFIDIYKSTSF
ncbi:uncharacterized protein OCT59_017869 [Rhizophagus irregularis]|uniref:uncharacterized protein n=1 Tax=Rhizophagus irregularis TaxID=588596 RepID=UPI001A0976F9|nr:hypothetical protein OCT59_017869 [Rhizophagus irregularis]GET66202.1 hypothetical protein GLOIN_2v1773495 [Rhizophagus irregularis DAOM 181602=DAOM 197198]